MSDLDPNLFRFPDLSPCPNSLPDAKGRKLPQPAPGEHYLGGRIPWVWICSAARLPGQALAVGIQLWYRARISKSSEVGISLSRLDHLGVSRSAASRALRELEDAGLVSVVRRGGRKPLVTILPVPKREERSSVRAG